MKLSLTLKVLTRIAAILIVVASAGFFSLAELRKQSEARGYIAHSIEIMNQLHVVKSSVKDAEIANEDYVLTAETQYLTRFTVAKQKLAAGLEALRTSVQDNPLQERELGSLTAKIDERLSEFQSYLVQARSNQRDQALADITSGRGKTLYEEIKSLAERMLATEGELLKRRTRELDEQEKRFGYAVIALIVLSICLLLVVSRIAWKQLVARQTAIEQLEKNQQLLSDDIALRKKVEADLLERESRTRALVETAPDAIIIFNSEGIIESTNKMIVTTFGWEPSDLVGRNISRLIPNFFTDTREAN